MIHHTSGLGLDSHLLVLLCASQLRISRASKGLTDVLDDRVFTAKGVRAERVKVVLRERERDERHDWTISAHLDAD